MVGPSDPPALLPAAPYWWPADRHGPPPSQLAAPTPVRSTSAWPGRRHTAISRTWPVLRAPPILPSRQQRSQRRSASPGGRPRCARRRAAPHLWNEPRLCGTGDANTDATHYEEDHPVPLEVGGAPRDPLNLWPESYASAHQKDQVENAAHAAICAGKLPLATAQAGFQSDWTVLGQQLGVFYKVIVVEAAEPRQ